MLDQHQRPLRDLRISVTDRCNLRCSYCMPEESYVWLPHERLLRFEELSALVDVFLALGVDHVRLTGGEPLLRRSLHTLVEMLARKPGLRDLALTTNGVLLAEQGPALRAAGLHRATVSLDTLDPRRFEALTRRDDHPRVLEGIAAARALGFAPLKLDTVVVRGVNDDELPALIEYGKRAGAEVRFIEYMDVGGATRWSSGDVFSRREMLDVLGRRYGAIEPLEEQGSAPAQRFRLADGTTFGIIASTTAPFCRTCDRARLTADGTLFLCLYATRGLDLRALIRSGMPPEAIAAAISAAWGARTDRGAEERKAIADRGPLVGIGELRSNPLLEMHTRGG